VENGIFSIREGEHPTSGSVDLDFLRKFAVRKFDELKMNGNFHERFGYPVDMLLQSTFQLEQALRNIKYDFFTNLSAVTRKEKFANINLETVETKDDVFDLFEYFYRVSSKPVIDSSPMHAKLEGYDEDGAKSEIRDLLNLVLPYFEDGWEIAQSGRICRLPPTGLEPLIENPLPENCDLSVRELTNNAIQKFHDRKATEQDRRSAIKELADVFEQLRKQARDVLTRKDENEISQLLNQFGIRHLNQEQRTDYPTNVFYPWIFYYLLASIHAITRLIELRGNDEKRE